MKCKEVCFVTDRELLPGALVPIFKQDSSRGNSVAPPGVCV